MDQWTIANPSSSPAGIEPRPSRTQKPGRVALEAPIEPAQTACLSGHRSCPRLLARPQQTLRRSRAFRLQPRRASSRTHPRLQGRPGARRGDRRSDATETTARVERSPVPTVGATALRILRRAAGRRVVLFGWRSLAFVRFGSQLGLDDSSHWITTWPLIRGLNFYS